jgi:hypothetical protein
MNDIFNDPPATYYDDDERFGTGPEMIADIRRLRAENARLREAEAETVRRICRILSDRIRLARPDMRNSERPGLRLADDIVLSYGLNYGVAALGGEPS